MNEMKVMIRKKPLRGRGMVSLANYQDRYIFSIAGKDPSTEDNSVLYKSVDLYDIDRNLWSIAPELNVPRGQHSSCALRNKVYTFGGFNSFNNKTGTCLYLNSIESLDAKGFIESKNSIWEIIQVQSNL